MGNSLNCVAKVYQKFSTTKYLTNFFHTRDKNHRLPSQVASKEHPQAHKKCSDISIAPFFSTSMIISPKDANQMITKVLSYFLPPCPITTEALPGFFPPYTNKAPTNTQGQAKMVQKNWTGKGLSNLYIHTRSDYSATLMIARRFKKRSLYSSDSP